MLARAAERLTVLVGDMVIPLEQEISKAAAKHFPRFQFDYGSLGEKLIGLALAGSDRIQAMNQELADVLFTDASDAPQRLGAETSALHDNLTWALEVKRSLENGLDATLRDLLSHRQNIATLPDTGIPGELRKELIEEIVALSDRLKKDDLYKHAIDFNSLLTHIKSRVREAVGALTEQQKLRIKEGVEDFQRLPEWSELTQEERSNAVSRLEGLATTVSPDLVGLKKLLACDYDISTTIDDIKRSINKQRQERMRKGFDEEAAKYKAEGKSKLVRSISVPARLVSAGDLNALIDQLNDLKSQVALYQEIELSLVIGGTE